MNNFASLNLLNVGCGSSYHNDWVNIDISGNPKEIQIVDIRNGIPFEEHTFDAVYSSHVLEHFSLINGLELLKEMYRVLKPNGVIRIVVPNLEDVARNYLRSLESVLECESEDNIYRYDWMYLEMYDQTTRTSSGGEMLKKMKNTNNGYDFMFQRIGYEMFNSEERDFIKQIPQLQHKKNIFIFGAGSFGKRIEKILMHHSTNIKGFIDNSNTLIGHSINNYPIYSLNDIPKDAFIIIASTWWKEIRKQLCDNGFKNYYVVSINTQQSPIANPKIEEVRQYINTELGSEYVAAFDEGVFRNKGEIHLQMYDQYSLKRILRDVGFSDITRKTAFESEILNFRNYKLDEVNGETRKPDSLFMEARKILSEGDKNEHTSHKH